MKEIFAVMSEPKLPCYRGKRLSVFPPGDNQQTCACGKSVGIRGNPDNIVVAFCNGVCYTQNIDDYLRVPHMEVSKNIRKKDRTLEEKYCAECGGKRFGGHKKDCTQSAKALARAARLKASEESRAHLPRCPDCDGIAFRKGWKHREGCEYNAKKAQARAALIKANRVPVVRDPCPVCGGPAKGRGWSHVDGCEKKSVPYVKKSGRGRKKKRIPKGVVRR